MKVENLVLISTYAKLRNCCTANIYKHIHKYNIVLIDGVKFIDKTNPIKIK